MTDRSTATASTHEFASPLRRCAVWVVLLASAGTFAPTMGVRQAMGLFLPAVNTSTGPGVGSSSLAFAFRQLWWGLSQPFAGAIADRIGTGRVILAGTVLIAIGTVITPLMTTTVALIFAIGVLATGIVHAGGPLGQFAMAPVLPIHEARVTRPGALAS